MNCTAIEKLLPLYIEDDVNEDEAVNVRSHLSSCERCFQLMEEFRASQERLH
ncbi:MAG: zf-HC2 domain-containing protein, partial [Acidobacteria bacterium]|nr:zf-HC2 domain-containing protein [Acidobacteriota bacterium]